jgi:hypothetical protein
MANTKLTDAQRVTLAAAAARGSGLVLPLPKSLGDNRGTLGIILKSLLSRKLVVERLSQPGEEVWRDTEELGRTTLVLSAEGMQVMGIDPAGDELQYDHVGDLVSDGDSSSSSTASTARSGAPAATSGTKIVTTPAPRDGTKLSALIAALWNAEGATIAELMEATGWQAHSVRGAMSGNLKKKLSLAVTSEVVENRGRVYRIATEGAAE